MKCTYTLAVIAIGTLGVLFGSFAAEIDENTPVPAVGAEGGPLVPLDAVQLEQWKRGRLVFDRDWKQSEGLGTDLNGDSCRSCHQDPLIGGAGGLDVNVSRFGSDNGGLGPFVDLPGGQGASKLRRPDTPGREEIAVGADVFEQRQTPTAFGLGLIDSISDATILANEDVVDLNGDQIFGVARMIDVAGNLEVGKFGWKSQIPQLVDFVADAMGNELGLTTVDRGRGFGVFTDSDGVPDPELSVTDAEDTLFYLANLAPPPRGGGAVAVGESHFTTIGCATCHTPILQGSAGPVALYSNLLLHNIHAPDFRGMSEPGAGVGMYRTPPLWGISRTAPYLHDGRAESLEEAILMHQGEADLVRQAYESLPQSDKDALIQFLEDL